MTQTSFRKTSWLPVFKLNPEASMCGTQPKEKENLEGCPYLLGRQTRSVVTVLTLWPQVGLERPCLPGVVSPGAVNRLWGAFLDVLQNDVRQVHKPLEPQFSSQAPFE